MKSKYTLAVLLIVAILISGCSKETSAQKVAVKSEPTAPKTEIKATSLGTTMVTSPSVDKVISGTVTIELTKVPAETGVAGFGIEKQGSTESGGPNLGLDQDGSDGWSYILDTTNYENGVYTAYSMVGESLQAQAPLGIVTAQVVIEN